MVNHQEDFLANHLHLRSMQRLFFVVCLVLGWIFHFPNVLFVVEVCRRVSLLIPNRIGKVKVVPAICEALDLSAKEIVIIED